MLAALKRVFCEPHRVFFLAAGLYGVFALSVWEIWLGLDFVAANPPAMPFAAAPYLWHAHEMIFGYASAALGGFFLTAVPNWTGSKDTAKYFVTGAALIWLAGRLAIWMSGILSPGFVAVVDLAFLPLLGVKIALMLVRRPKPQNLAFLAFLSLVWAGNLMVHLEWLGLTDDTLYTGLRVGLLSLCLMIAVLGGRVTPGFTRNAMKRAGVDESTLPTSRKPVDLAASVMIALVPLALLLRVPDALTGALAVAGGALHLLRIAFWRPFWTLGQPILWALHLGMAMLGLGLVLWGSSLLGWGSEVAGLHVLGIGAVGGMTVAVMSRAILGHTGRALIAPRAVALAYALIAAAAGLRWSASALSGDLYGPAILATGALWIAGFSLFTVALWPAFTGPRVPRDASPGA